jgi:hypothetical protein
MQLRGSKGIENDCVETTTMHQLAIAEIRASNMDTTRIASLRGRCVAWSRKKEFLILWYTFKHQRSFCLQYYKLFYLFISSKV